MGTTSRANVGMAAASVMAWGGTSANAQESFKTRLSTGFAFTPECFMILELENTLQAMPTGLTLALARIFARTRSYLPNWRLMQIRFLILIIGVPDLHIGELMSVLA